MLLHVGYHKTATTWMQTRLFQPEHGYRQLAGHQEIFDLIVHPHGLDFDPEPMRALIARGLEGLGPGEIPVLSSEILSGHPFFGGRESDVLAARLKAIAPEARILISIRNQMRILPSVYMQYVLRGGTSPYDRFFEGSKDLGFFGFEAQNFEYDRLVGLYQRLFGAEAVYVLPQEALQKDMQAAADGLARFAGMTEPPRLVPEALAPHHSGYPEYTAPVLRRINHVTTSPLNPTPVLGLGRSPSFLFRSAGYLLRRPPLSALLGRGKPVSDYVKKHFAGRYTEANRRLAAMLHHPVDLSAYLPQSEGS